MIRYSLEEFIFDHWYKTCNKSKTEAVTRFASEMGTSYSTVYNWIRSEEYFVLTSSDPNEKKKNDGYSIEIVRVIRSDIKKCRPICHF